MRWKAAKKAAAKTAQAPAIIAALEKRIAESPGLVGEVQAVIELRIADPDGGWTIDLKSGKGSVKPGVNATPTTTLTISDSDFAALCAGEGLAQDFFQKGKLRVDGDMNVAKRLGFLNKLPLPMKQPAGIRSRIIDHVNRVQAVKPDVRIVAFVVRIGRHEVAVFVRVIRLKGEFRPYVVLEHNRRTERLRVIRSRSATSRGRSIKCFVIRDPLA